jgi:hypothetical protein
MSDLESAVLRGDTRVRTNALQGSGRRWWFAVAILALAGTGLVLLSTAKYGAGISPDSTAYFDVARNLLAGKGLVFHAGGPLVIYAPLYPILLALVGRRLMVEPGRICVHQTDSPRPSPCP